MRLCRLLIVLAHLSAGLAVPAAAETAARFIPVELWTGGSWNPDPAIRWPTVDVTFGQRDDKRIRGPIDWTRPGTGERIRVYERSNRGKVQLFTPRRDGQGLGRVYDSRYGRDCIEDIKFPLGVWKQGETRRYSILCNGGKLVRDIAVTVQELDFEHDGIAHSLRFRWIADGGARRGTDMTYTYSPGRGLVDLREN